MFIIAGEKGANIGISLLKESGTIINISRAIKYALKYRTIDEVTVALAKGKGVISAIESKLVAFVDVAGRARLSSYTILEEEYLDILDIVLSWNKRNSSSIMTEFEVSAMIKAHREGKSFDEVLSAIEGATQASKIKSIINDVLKTRLGEIANGLLTKPTGGKYTPMTTSAAYNSKTGSTFLGHSGIDGFNPSRLDSIHPELQKRVDAISKTAEAAGKSTWDGYPSFESWRIENCAEFNAINQALYDGANFSEITIKTVVTKDGSFKAPCENCIRLFEGVNFID